MPLQAWAWLPTFPLTAMAVHDANANTGPNPAATLTIATETHTQQLGLKVAPYMDVIVAINYKIRYRDAILQHQSESKAKITTKPTVKKHLQEKK